MSLLQAVRRCLGRYLVCSGRATRAEFWWWFLAANAAIFVTVVLDAVIVATLSFAGITTVSPLALLLVIGIALPSLAVAVRRLHDIGKSGWWILAWFAVDFAASLAFAMAWAFVVFVFLLGDPLLILGNTGPGAAGVLALWISVLAVTAVSGAAILAVHIWALVWLIRQGEAGPNRYGPDPRAWQDSGTG